MVLRVCFLQAAFLRVFLSHCRHYHLKIFQPCSSPRHTPSLLPNRILKRINSISHRIIQLHFPPTLHLQTPLLRIVQPTASLSPTPANDIKPVVPWKTPTSVWSPENLIPPPKDGEILLERRPNRALPPYVAYTTTSYFQGKGIY